MTPLPGGAKGRGAAGIGLLGKAAAGARHAAAVGADRRHLLLMVAVQAGRFLGAGLLLGFSIAFAVGPFLRPLLFGIPASDVTVHLVVLATLAAVGSLAVIGPAMRATSINPRTALEAE